MKRRGFTLIEIMVVVGIIGLLAGIGIPAVLKGRQYSKIKRAQTELEMISAATLQLAWDTGKWPNARLRNNGGSAEIWDISPSRCGLMDTDGSYNDWKGPYYGGETMDPWGNPYFFDPDYRVDGANRVVVGSFGPNGVGKNQYDRDDVYVLLDD